MTAACRVSVDESNHDLEGQKLDRKWADSMRKAKADMAHPHANDLGPFCRLGRPLVTYLREAIEYGDHTEIRRVIERAPHQMQIIFTQLMEIHERDAYAEAIAVEDEDDAGKVALKALTRLRAQEYVRG